MENKERISHESKFWLMMYKEQQKKVDRLQYKIERLKDKLKECGIGNDHEDFSHSGHYLS